MKKVKRKYTRKVNAVESKSDKEVSNVPSDEDMPWDDRAGVPVMDTIDKVFSFNDLYPYR